MSLHNSFMWWDINFVLDYPLAKKLFNFFDTNQKYHKNSHLFVFEFILFMDLKQIIN